MKIKDFYEGNEYYMFVYEVYRDVRLVGAPPSSIGKFGDETDNWVWPRHTGDFSMFRIYTAPDGKPAAYAKENIPLKPKHHLPVSARELNDGDFAQRFNHIYGVDYFKLPVAYNFGQELVKIPGLDGSTKMSKSDNGVSNLPCMSMYWV